MRRLGAFGGSAAGHGAAQVPGGRPGCRQPGRAANEFRFQDFDIGESAASAICSRRCSAAGRIVPVPALDSVNNVGRRSDGPRVPFRSRRPGQGLVNEVNEGATCATDRARPGATSVCRWRRGDLVRSGRIRGEPSVSHVPQRGQVPSERCPKCGGSGEVRNRKKVAISVPPGSDTGTKIRLKGQGGRGAAGAPPGDLVITLQVQPDRFYKRDGLDLIATVPINIAQATLGSKISVTTLDKKRVAIRIPPGTASGRRFRVRGQGIGKDGQRGDLIIEVQISVPEKLTEEQERMMKEFAEAGGLKY